VEGGPQTFWQDFRSKSHEQEDHHCQEEYRGCFALEKDPGRVVGVQF